MHYLGYDRSPSSYASESTLDTKEFLFLFWLYTCCSRNQLVLTIANSTRLTHRQVRICRAVLRSHIVFVHSSVSCCWFIVCQKSLQNNQIIIGSKRQVHFMFCVWQLNSKIGKKNILKSSREVERPASWPVQVARTWRWQRMSCGHPWLRVNSSISKLHNVRKYML